MPCIGMIKRDAQKGSSCCQISGKVRKYMDLEWDLKLEGSISQVVHCEEVEHYYLSPVTQYYIMSPLY